MNHYGPLNQTGLIPIVHFRPLKACPSIISVTRPWQIDSLLEGSHEACRLMLPLSATGRENTESLWWQALLKGTPTSLYMKGYKYILICATANWNHKKIMHLLHPQVKKMFTNNSKLFFPKLHPIGVLF